MRVLCIAVLTSAVIAMFSAGPSLAQSADPPEEITLESCGDTQASVTFPHKAHFENVECTTCHHSQEGLTLEAAQGGMAVETCSSCHVEPEEESTPNCAERGRTKNPFHIRCVGCHRESTAEDETLSAPTKCTECHPKPEG